MKSFYLLSALAAMSVLPASGGNNFPQVRQFSAADVQTPLLAPAHSAAATSATAHGKTLYCGVLNDLLRRAGGMATYNTADPMNSLTLLNPNALTWYSSSDFDAPRCGAYVKGKYYAYIYRTYTFVNEMKGFGTLDLETGDYTQISGPVTTPTWAAVKKQGADSKCEGYSTVYSMAYDNKNDVLYCVYFDITDYMGTIANCVLGTVDVKTGKITKVAELSHLYYNIAVDYFGNLYGLTYKLADENDAQSGIVGTYLTQLKITTITHPLKPNETTVAEEHIQEVVSSDGYAYTSNYFQDMDFDHDDWIIRWNRVGSDGTYVCELDPTTGVYSDSRLIGSNATVVGIYAPYASADSPEAPGHVTDLVATAGANGAQEVTLTWTNPTKAWNRTELSELALVNIYRGEELIGIVDEGVVKGGQSSFLDKEAELGYNDYKIVACRNEGEEGLPTTVRCFVGYDTPGAASSIVLTSPDNQSAYLTWEAPARGSREGWYDPATLTYTLTRLPDNVVVARDITETSFVDTTLPTTMCYSYEIQTANAAGKGLTACSNQLTIGPAITAPYNVTFDSANKAQTWTAIDANNDGDSWRYEAHPWYAWISTQYGNTGKDWLVSPNFSLKANTSYRVRFCLRVTNHTNAPKEYITFAYGQGQTAAAMSNILDSHLLIENQEDRYYSYTLTADAEGIYNFGLLAEGESGNFGTYFTAFAITEIASKDLAATQLSGPTEISATAAATYTVTVTNKGAKVAENYTVQLVDDDDNVLAQVASTEALNPQSEKAVAIKWAPAASLAHQTLLVYGRVIMDGDGDAGNDNTEPLTVNIGEVNSSVWVDMTPADSWTSELSQIVPLNFMYMSCWSETIYPSSLFNLGAGEYAVSKMSFEYQFGSAVELQYEAYVGTTTKEYFTAATDLIGKSGLTQVKKKTTLDMARGTGTLTINFDTPVTWNGTDNLVVALNRPYNSYNDGDVFNNWFEAYETNDYSKSPSIQYGYDSGSFDWTGSSRTYTFSQIPAIHFCVEDLQSQGLHEVLIGTFGVVLSRGSLTINNGTDIQHAALYDAAGSRVAVANVQGCTATISTESLAHGIYVVECNGKSMKIRL